jgi:plastocyanin
MKNSPHYLRFIVVAGFLMVFSTRLNADTYDVVFGQAYGPAFQPQSVTILPGDTVVWYNYGWFGSGPQTLQIASDSADGPDAFYVWMGGWGSSGSHTFYASGTHAYTGVNSVYPGGHFPGTVIVQSPVPLTDPKLIAGKFTFTATGLTGGKTNILQCSTNLDIRNWTTIATNIASGISMSFTNTPSASSSYYRVIEVP